MSALAIGLAEKVTICRIRSTARRPGSRRRRADRGRAAQGTVLIVDDVITAGTSVRESVAIIRAAGAEPARVLIMLDRMERGTGTLCSLGG